MTEFNWEERFRKAGGCILGQGSKRQSLAEISALADRIAGQFARERNLTTVTVQTSSPMFLLALILAAKRARVCLKVLHPWMAMDIEPQVNGIKKSLGFGEKIFEGNVHLSSSDKYFQSPGVVLFSSGSMGPPKPKLYSFERLSDFRSDRKDLEEGWASFYPPTSFAGIQFLFYALHFGKVILFGKSMDDFREDISREARHWIISGTPTSWKASFLQRPLDGSLASRITTISLGGEIVDQRLIDQLVEKFPKASLIHIYGTSELGTLFAVKDKLEGFPLKLLCPPAGTGSKLQIREGELYAQNRMTGIFLSTGDQVVVDGERVKFLGRKGRSVKVAGVIVDIPTVERIIVAIPGVVDVRVKAVPDRICGHILSAEVVLASNALKEQTEANIRDAFGSETSRPMRPRRLSFSCGFFPLPESGKKDSGVLK